MKMVNLFHSGMDVVTCTIVKIPNSNRPYEACFDRVTRAYQQHRSESLHFPSAVRIPNQCKFDELFARTLTIYRIQETSPTLLHLMLHTWTIEFPMQPTGFINIHNCGPPLSINVDGITCNIRLGQNQSLILRGPNSLFYRTQIVPSTVPQVVAIEILAPMDIVFDTGIDEQFPFINIKTARLSYPENSILFIEALRAKSPKSIAPNTITQISIIDFVENTVLNTRITPRAYVNYPQSSNADLTNGMDEMAACNQIRRIITNKIVVGFHLKDLLRYLQMPCYQVKEIRELSKSQDLEAITTPQSDEFKLEQLAVKLKILGPGKDKFPYMAVDDTLVRAQVLKKIYCLIHNNWTGQQLNDPCKYEDLQPIEELSEDMVEMESMCQNQMSTNIATAIRMALPSNGQIPHEIWIQSERYKLKSVLYNNNNDETIMTQFV